MRSDFLFGPERFLYNLRLLIPYGFLGLFFALDVIAFSLPPFGTIRPNLTLMAVFYWSIYRPTLLPNWCVFLLGLAMDVVSAVPVGLNACVYLLVNWVISDQRRFFVGQPFIAILTGFMLVLLISTLLRWVLFGVFSFYWPPLESVAGSMAFGLFLFPVVNILLHMIHKLLPFKNPGVTAP